MYRSLFRDRSDAGRRLAQRLLHLKGSNPLVLALPRGGVPVAIEIAKALSAPLDLLLVRKIGVPWQPELAAGAVLDGETPRMVVNEDVVRSAGVPLSDIEEIAKQEIREIERRRKLWLSGRPRVRVAGHCAIVVDDGIATGATTRVALRAMRAEKASRVVLAVPVAPPDAIEALKRDCDEAVVIATPEDFVAVGIYYQDFRQLEDDDVRALLNHVPAPKLNQVA